MQESLLGPYALGSLIAINGSPIIQINEIVRAFGEIGGILILFVAGLEMTFRDFRKVGTAGFVIGTLGVIIPFIMGYGLSLALGLGTIAGLVVGAALVATSISITALVLQELNQSRKIESRMMISAAVVDDVLGLAILGVIVSFISTSTPITALSVIIVISTSLALWLTLTVFAAIVLPKIINFTSKGKEGVVEALSLLSLRQANKRMNQVLKAKSSNKEPVGPFAKSLITAISAKFLNLKRGKDSFCLLFYLWFFSEYKQPDYSYCDYNCNGAGSEVHFSRRQRCHWIWRCSWCWFCGRK